MDMMYTHCTVYTRCTHIEEIFERLSSVF